MRIRPISPVFSHGDLNNNGAITIAFEFFVNDGHHNPFFAGDFFDYMIWTSHENVITNFVSKLPQQTVTVTYTPISDGVQKSGLRICHRGRGLAGRRQQFQGEVAQYSSSLQKWVVVPDVQVFRWTRDTTAPTV